MLEILTCLKHSHFSYANNTQRLYHSSQIFTAFIFVFLALHYVDVRPAQFVLVLSKDINMGNTHTQCICDITCQNQPFVTEISF